MTKKIISPVIRYCVSIGLVAMIALRSDLNAFWNTIIEVKVTFIVVALLATIFNMLIRSIKWQMLLRVQGTRLPINTVQYMNYVSLFFNSFFLGSIGGDAFRVYRTVGYSDSMSGATSSVIMDRVTGFFMLLMLILGIGLWFVSSSGELLTIEQLFVIAMIGCVAGLLFIIVFKLPSTFIKLKIFSKIPKIRKFIENMMDSIQLYKINKKTVVLSLILSSMYHIGNSFKVFCFAKSANVDVSLMPLIFITSLVAILVMMPVSINGIGIQEASYIFYLERIGVAEPAALLIAVLSRVSLLFFSLVGGLLYLIYDGKYRQMTSETD